MPVGGLIVPPPPSRYQQPLEADGGDEAAVSRRPECENCGATAMPGNPPRPLMRCSRCRAAQFCSRACQRQSWPFHRAACRRNDFADAAEAAGERKFAEFLRGHGRLAQLRDAEVERLEAAGGGGGGGGGGSWRGMSRAEVMDSMYGRALPLPRAPTWGDEGAKGRSAPPSAPPPAEGAAAAAQPGLSSWAKAAGFEAAAGMGVAGAKYAWSQNLSHVEVAVRLPREVAEARRRRAAERWRAKATAADEEQDEDEEEAEQEKQEERLRQPRLCGAEGRHVQVELTATALRVAVVDGRSATVGRRGAGGGNRVAVAAETGKSVGDDDEVLLSGELEAAVKVSECTWYIDDDAGVVRLSLLKRCRRGHYDAAPARGEAAASGRAATPAAAESAPAAPRLRTNADTFWRGVLRGAPASMRLPEGPPPVAYYACAYEADD